MLRRSPILAALAALCLLAGGSLLLLPREMRQTSPPPRPREAAPEPAPVPGPGPETAPRSGAGEELSPPGPGASGAAPADPWEEEEKHATDRIDGGFATTRAGEEEGEDDDDDDEGAAPAGLLPGVPDPNPLATMWAETLSAALVWLAAHQQPDGCWDAEGLVTPEDGAGVGTEPPAPDTAATGLALLAFLHRGHTHKHGQHKRNVREGLRWLKQVQGPGGRFGRADAPFAVLDHAVATAAMVEAYRATASPLFKQSARIAAAALAPEDGPWDAVAAAWAALALDRARRTNLETDPPTLAPLTTVLVLQVDALPPDRRLVLAAARILARAAAGEEPSGSGPARAAPDLLVDYPPRFEVFPDPEHWCLGALALSRGRPAALDAWREGFLEEARARQRTEPTDLAGSFDPLGSYEPRPGRVATTALIVLALAAMGHPPLRVLDPK